MAKRRMLYRESFPGKLHLLSSAMLVGSGLHLVSIKPWPGLFEYTVGLFLGAVLVWDEVRATPKRP